MRATASTPTRYYRQLLCRFAERGECDRRLQQREHGHRARERHNGLRGNGSLRNVGAGLWTARLGYRHHGLRLLWRGSLEADPAADRSIWACAMTTRRSPIRIRAWRGDTAALRRFLRQAMALCSPTQGRAPARRLPPSQHHQPAERQDRLRSRASAWRSIHLAMARQPCAPAIGFFFGRTNNGMILNTYLNTGSPAGSMSPQPSSRTPRAAPLFPEHHLDGGGIDAELVLLLQEFQKSGGL